MALDWVVHVISGGDVLLCDVPAFMHGARCAIIYKQTGVPEVRGVATPGYTNLYARRFFQLPYWAAWSSTQAHARGMRLSKRHVPCVGALRELASLPPGRGLTDPPLGCE